MSEPREYSADDIKVITPNEVDLAAVDLSREAFCTNLVESATLARDFARTLVTTLLPDQITYIVLYGCSYDGNPLREDEKTFPEDYDQEPPTSTSPDEITTLLWRDGFVPEWINVMVSHEDGEQTHIKLECCGRYSAMPEMMYHIQEGRPPFHVLGPPMPPDFESNQGSKFNLYWRKDV
jgi:hypothetical protein